MNKIRTEKRRASDKKSNDKKAAQLGMSHAHASIILKKNIMFDLIKRCNLDICFQCKNKIENVEDLSIEHKKHWQDSENPIELFFNLDNIAFSHKSCNYSAARRDTEDFKKSKKKCWHSLK